MSEFPPLFKSGQYSVVYLDHCLFICSPVDGHLICFPILLVDNDPDDMNEHECADISSGSLFPVLLGGTSKKRLLDHAILL